MQKKFSLLRAFTDFGYLKRTVLSSRVGATFWPKVVLFCEKRAAQRVDVGNTGVELMPE